MRLIHLLKPLDIHGRIKWPALFFFYVICNFFHIASWNSKYWDQWIMYKEVSAIRDFETSCPISRCKLPFTYFWEQPLLEIGTWALRMVVVLAFLLAGYLLSLILEEVRQITPRQRSIIVVLFLLLPINGARIGLTTARSSLALAIFLLGVILVQRRGTTAVVIGLSLISYTMFWDSFQVFALAAPIPMMLGDVAAKRRISNFSIGIMVTICCLAIANRYILKDLVVSLGVAAPDDGYNSIRPIFLIRAILISGLLIVPFGFRVIQKIAKLKTPNPRTPWLVEVGMLLLALGTFPYIAAGHFANLSDWIMMWLPDASDWDSRHQLLQGFGFAVIGVGFFETCREVKVNKILIITIFFCITVNLGTYSSYYVDGLKQHTLMETLRSKSIFLEDVTTFGVIDDARDLNARGRIIRDYEWEGMIEAALHRPVEIWNPQIRTTSCTTEVVGITLRIRKTSGKLATLMTRSRPIEIDFLEIFDCRTR